MTPFWRRARRDAELEEEIAGHLAMAARERGARGETPADARYAARREFGNATLVKEVTRQTWGGAWLEGLARDLRLAVRSLRRSPGFLVVTVLALGLGLGLSTTMFAVLEAVRHPLPAYANGDRIFMLSVRSSYRSGQRVPPDAVTSLIARHAPAIDAVVSFGAQREPILIGGEPREEFQLIAPGRWFDVMGIRPERGRIFTPADGDGVAVVSHEVWRYALHGRRDLAGVHVRIGDRSYAVVGVLPHIERGASAILPERPADERASAVAPIVRVRPGVTRQQADRELAVVAGLLTATYGVASSPWDIKLMPWLDAMQQPEQLATLHLAMVGSALAVLLIACVNLAHLMLARGLAKRRELALRMALGARRAAAVRVMLAEVALVSAAGLALGAVLAVWGSRVLEAILPYDLGWLSWMGTRLSWRVFGLAALAAVLSGVLFGLFPALRIASAVHLTDPLKDEGGTTTGRPRRYSTLVIAEVALALALLMGGALLLRSVHQLRNSFAGFEAETLVNASVTGVRTTRARPGGGVDTLQTFDLGQVLATARGVPGVAAAALQTWAATRGAAVTAELEGDSTRMVTMLQFRIVSPNYLDVHGLPILRGRDFEAGDAAGDGAAILSAAAAARLYPRGDAVGRMIKLGGPRAQAPWVRIVGVARTPTAPWESLPGQGEDAPFWVTRPLSKIWSVTALVRAPSRDPEVLLRLRQALRTVPGVRTVSVQPFTRMRDASIASFDFLAEVFLAIGAMGLGLAALGLYGVLSYAVSRRLREFGVRIALGAEPRVLFRTVMHDGLVMLLAGTGIGAFGALAATSVFSSVVVGVQPTDAISLVAAEAILLLVGLAATLAPALKAVRANPVDILRSV